MDRRIRKSRQALKKSLFDLMCRKPYSQITISELCELSDLNRSTFYSNYSHMDELLKEIHYDLLNGMMNQKDLNLQQLDIETFRKTLLTGMIQYLQTHKNNVNVLFLNNENHLLERNMMLFFLERYGESKISNVKNYPLVYHTIAFFTLIHQWIKDNYPCSSEELAELIIQHSKPFYESASFKKY